MSTYPTTPRERRGKPCYTCTHLYDISPLGHAVCNRELEKTGFKSVQSNAPGGCVFWHHDPQRAEISTHDEWIALHGQGLTGFSERSDRIFRPAMSAADARQAVRCGDAAALGWEVARLQDIERRLFDALEALLRHIELENFREDIRLLRTLMARQEPAVAAHAKRKAEQRAKWQS